MGCPWKPDVAKGEPWYTTYPPCSNHYEGELPLEWKVNTGVCSVPSWGNEPIAWAIGSGRLNIRDTSRDDFTANLTDGRYWSFEHRAS